MPRLWCQETRLPWSSLRLYVPLCQVLENGEPLFMDIHTAFAQAALERVEPLVPRACLSIFCSLRYCHKL